MEQKYDYISGFVCITCGRMNAPVLIDGWIEPLCESCYNKRMVAKRHWYEKNYKDHDFTYTPYDDLNKEKQEIKMVATYKCWSSEQGDYEKKCDYSDTINRIMKRQEKLFERGGKN